MVKNMVLRKWAALMLSTAMAVSYVPASALPVSAATKPKISISKKSVTKGKKLSVTVKNIPAGATVTFKSSKKAVLVAPSTYTNNKKKVVKSKTFKFTSKKVQKEVKVTVIVKNSSGTILAQKKNVKISVVKAQTTTDTTDNTDNTENTDTSGTGDGTSTGGNTDSGSTNPGGTTDQGNTDQTPSGLTEATAATITELSDAVKNNPNLKKLTFKTADKTTLDIQAIAGSEKVDLIVEAPSATIYNSSKWNSITIKAISADSWHERGASVSNSITMDTAANVDSKVSVDAGTTTQAINVVGANAKVTVEVNGTLGALNVSGAGAKITLLGPTGAKATNVDIAAANVDYAGKMPAAVTVESAASNTMLDFETGANNAGAKSTITLRAGVMNVTARNLTGENITATNAANTITTIPGNGTLQTLIGGDAAAAGGGGTAGGGSTAGGGTNGGSTAGGTNTNNSGSNTNNTGTSTADLTSAATAIENASKNGAFLKLLIDKTSNSATPAIDALKAEMKRLKLYDPDRVDFIVYGNYSADIPYTENGSSYQITIELHSKVNAAITNPPMAYVSYAFLDQTSGEGKARTEFKERVNEQINSVFGSSGQTEATALNESELATPLSLSGIPTYYDNNSFGVKWSSNNAAIKLTSPSGTGVTIAFAEVTRPSSKDGAPVKVALTAEMDWKAKPSDTSTIHFTETRELWVQTKADPTTPRLKSLKPYTSSNKATLVYQVQEAAVCAGSGVTKVEWAIADVSKSSSIKEADLNWQTFPNDSEATFDVDMTTTDTVTSGTQTTTKTINAKYKCYVRMYYTNRVVTTQGTTKTVSYQDQVTKTVIGDEVVLGNSYMPTPVVTNITANSITVSPVNPINISTGTYTALQTEYAVSTSPSAPADGSNNWTTATTIGGLSANTKYYVFARSTGIAPNETKRRLVPDSVSAAVGPYVTLTAVNLQVNGSVIRSPYTQDLNIFGNALVDVYQAVDGSTMVWLSGAVNMLSNTDVSGMANSGRVATDASTASAIQSGTGLSGKFASVYVKMPTDYESNNNAYKDGVVLVDGNATKLDGNVVVLSDGNRYIHVIVDITNGTIDGGTAWEKQFFVDWDGQNKNVLSSTYYTLRWAK